MMYQNSSYLSRVAILTSLACVCLSGCGKTVPTGSYINDKGDYLEVNAVGDSYEFRAWSIEKFGDPKPVVTSPLSQQEDGSLNIDALKGRLVPTEEGLTVYLAGESEKYKPIDLSKVPEAQDEGMSFKAQLEKKIDSFLIKPIETSQKLICNGFGNRRLKKREVPHLIEALKRGVLKDFESKREVHKTTTLYDVSAMWHIPAYSTEVEIKECVKYKRRMFGRTCRKRALVAYKVTIPELNLPVVASGAVAKKLVKGAEERRKLEIEKIGEIKGLSNASPMIFCQHHIMPDKKSIISLKKLDPKNPK